MVRHKIEINGVQYKSFRNLKIKKARNKIATAEFHMYATEVSDYTTNINYNKLVVIEEWNGTDYDEIFRGYIRDVSKISYKKTKIFCYDPSIKFFDRSWDERKQYTNIATNTILAEVASGIMGVGTNSITEVISTRFELDNKLRSIAQLANIHNGEWWIDTDAVLADRVNLAYARYSDTPVTTINIGTEFFVSDDDEDYDKIFNCITVLGRGDGINQVKAQTYGFCYYQPDLSGDITATATSLNVTDSAGMSATNGIIYINNEKIKYGNRTGNNLYNLTRGYGGTTAVAHSSGMRVWYAGTTSTEYTKTNAAPNSSVDEYGIREYTYPDTSILRDISGDPNETAGRVGVALQNRFDTAVRVITLKRRKLLVGDLGIGKTVTIVDAQTGLNGNFKIFSIEISNVKGSKGLTVQANNIPYDFSTTLDELQKNMDTTTTYEQGATNIYAVSMYENCDTSHPLNMRFYLPSEAVAINKVFLNFQLKGFRAYSGTTSNESSHTHGIPALDVEDHRHGIPSLTVNNHSHSIPSLTVNATTSDARTSSSQNAKTIFCMAPEWSGSAAEDTSYLKINNDIDVGSNYYILGAMVYNGSGASAQVRLKWADAHGQSLYSDPATIGHGEIIVLVQQSASTSFNLNDTIEVSKNTGFPYVADGIKVCMMFEGRPSHSHSINTSTTQTNTSGASGSTTASTTSNYAGSTTASETTQTGSAHSHGISGQITETPLTSPSVNVYAGIEGSETFVGTYTSNQTNIDVTSIIEDVGAGNWINIKFTPNKNMRIEANAYIQIYIESQ